MENENRILIPENVLADVLNLLKNANHLILPYVTALTPTERRTLAKMGEKTLSFVEKAHEYAKLNPNFVPSYLNMADFDIDLADARNLWSTLLASQQLHENLDDTSMVAGSEAYQAALVFYSSVKEAAHHDVPSAKAIYEELKKRFPHGRRKKTDTINQETEEDS
jgi:hypothetical protein